MLRVGINTNVTLAGASINDKGSLVVSFRDGNSPVVSVEEDLLNDTAGVKPSTGVTNIIIWPVQIEQNGQEREVKDIANDLRAVRDQLEHLLLGYLTSENATLKPYEGIDTSDKAAFASSLKTQPGVDRIYKNLTSQFIAKVAELKDRIPVETFRLLLVRRSAANHYGTFRKNFITDNPFWESEKIPQAASRLAFTKYEKTKKYDNGEPVVKDPAADTVGATESSAADEILGSR